MPPAHGAAIVAQILNDTILTNQWQSELNQMRERILLLRHGLVDTFRTKTGSNKFDYIGLHKGMFSMTGLNDTQIQALQRDHAIYLVRGGRINIAGLQEDQIDRVVSAFITVGA